jgi:formylmethanofuran dehydrogenase subunit E
MSDLKDVYSIKAGGAILWNPSAKIWSLGAMKTYRESRGRYTLVHCSQCSEPAVQIDATYPAMMGKTLCATCKDGVRINDK